MTLKTVNDTVTIIVGFDARFSPFERQLAALGMTYHSHVDVVGIDNGTDIEPTIVSSTTSRSQSRRAPAIRSSTRR